MPKYLTLILLTLSITACSTQQPKPEVVLNLKSRLGEGALWNHKTQQLYWVDITGKTLNIYNPATNENIELRTGQNTSTVVPSESGKVLVALANGIYQMDTNTGSKTFINDPDSLVIGNRYNDGKCDPAGRFWVGTIKNDEANNGALYCFYGDGSAQQKLTGISISNGIAWSLGQNKMYYIDTPTQQVKVFDYNNEDGSLSNEKVAFEIPKGIGAPDGMAIDENGNLWIALWGGAAVACWNPETGEMVDKIPIPAKNVTSCAFGGNDLATLYITTATQGLSPKELEDYPLSGALVKVNAGVKGVPAFFYKGNY